MTPEVIRVHRRAVEYAVAAYLAGGCGGVIGPGRTIALDDALRYLVPQHWSGGGPPLVNAPELRPSLRVKADEPQARVVLRVDGRALWTSSSRALLRDRRVRVNLSALPSVGSGDVRVELERV